MVPEGEELERDGDGDAPLGHSDARRAIALTRCAAPLFGASRQTACRRQTSLRGRASAGQSLHQLIQEFLSLIERLHLESLVAAVESNVVAIVKESLHPV